MIYDSLDIIPYKTFLKIADTGNIKLLVSSKTPTDDVDEKKLAEIWEMLKKEHEDNEDPNESTESKKVFRLSKEIDYLETQYSQVLMACVALRFDWHDELVELLQGYGYKLRNTDTQTYYDDIDRIEREAKGLVFKVSLLKKQLPKPNENNEFNIDDIMAGYCAILGFDIGDFNEVTYNKFKGMRKQVHAKMKVFEKEEQERKNNKSNGSK